MPELRLRFDERVTGSHRVLDGRPECLLREGVLLVRDGGEVEQRQLAVRQNDQLTAHGRLHFSMSSRIRTYNRTIAASTSSTPAISGGLSGHGRTAARPAG